MIDLNKRSEKKELLDKEGIPFADIQQNMKELNRVNTFLGGHAITIKGVKKIIENYPAKQLLTICEIGCGGGDNLIAINKWCNKKGIPVQFIGIDIKQECIDFAKSQCNQLNSVWIKNDYAAVSFKEKPVIIFSSLFCHHFKEQELLQMMQWMKNNSNKGFFINDLHRHPLAYYSIKFITSIFSNSYLVKNDAPLSVARGFKKEEWTQLLLHSNVTNYTVQWQWAFRYLIIFSHERK
jgi:2-polyprenyl-3-methyl-5-hydroxy-6-metoxy-1,4-benzoquinol methylase